MARRKTIAVERIRGDANKMLRDSVDDYRQGREGIARLLERVLMETDNYHGFQFTDGATGDKDRTRRYYY